MEFKKFRYSEKTEREYEGDLHLNRESEKDLRESDFRKNESTNVRSTDSNDKLQ